MNWEMATKIILGIIALFSGITLTIVVHKKVSNRNQKKFQKIKGNNNIQAGGSIHIERGIESDDKTRN
jgi:hypothetical protein